MEKRVSHMYRRSLVSGLAALSAFAICMILPGVASGSPVLTVEGKAVASGTKIIGTQTESFVLTAGETTFACERSTVTGEVTKNTGSLFQITVRSATFADATGPDCTSNSFGDVTFTTEIAKIDWCISSSGSDAFSLQAGACGATAVALKFTIDNSFVGPCVYRREGTNPVTGTYTTGSDVLRIGSGAASQFFSTSFGCPGSGSLDGGYTLELDETTTPVSIS